MRFPDTEHTFDQITDLTPVQSRAFDLPASLPCRSQSRNPRNAPYPNHNGSVGVSFWNFGRAGAGVRSGLTRNRCPDLSTDLSTRSPDTNSDGGHFAC